jgi:uncharacterized protein
LRTLHANLLNTEDAESTEKAEKIALAMKHKCPICKTETDSTVQPDFPFCSERCRERDLGNWASEKYVVSEPIFDEEEGVEGEGKTMLLDGDKPHDDEQ